MSELLQIQPSMPPAQNRAEQPSPRRLPPWLTVRLPKRQPIEDVQSLMRERRLHTVCEEARCPNLWECWSKKTATFMILGDICTRSCRFCAVKTGRGGPLDPNEPANVADAAAALGLRHVVVTSVNRDELENGGAEHFAATIRALREKLPRTVIEVLTPDFLGKKEAIQIVVDARPHVFNHNIETVPRLYRRVRPQARYARSLEVLRYAKEANPNIYTKSGLMVGLGETQDEVLDLMRDLRAHNVDIVTIGQYLKPGKGYLEVEEYIHPDVFAEYKRAGEEIGFLFIASGPFVRSSYNAIEFSEKMELI